MQYLFFSPFTIEGLPNNINTIGISLKWDLWDWGNKRHLMDEKQRGIEQSQLNLTETQTQVAIDINNRYRKLREARAGLKVAELGEDAEKQKLGVVTVQYKQNAALLSTLQTEQANMAQAAAQYQQALSNFWSARSEFERRWAKTDETTLFAWQIRDGGAGGRDARAGRLPGRKEMPETPLTPVTVAEVRNYTGTEGVNYSASIVPYQQVPVSFKSGGYVTSILQRKGVDGRVRNLQMGDFVKKGTVLATVRQNDYQQSVDQYKGQLEQAKAGAQKSQQDWDRAQALYKASAMTQSDYDAAKAQYDSSQGSVATAQAGVSQAEQALRIAKCVRRWTRRCSRGILKWEYWWARGRMHLRWAKRRR